MPDKPQDEETLLLLLIALLVPAFAVFMMRGCGHEVLICILLGLLFVIPGHIYAYCLVAEHYRENKARRLRASGYPAQSSQSNVVQVVPASPPAVVQAIEYKPQPAALLVPPPPTPVSPTPAPAAPAPAPAPTVTEQVVVVTKSPEKAPEKAPEAPPAVVPVAAAK